jgi:hypothetical protein
MLNGGTRGIHTINPIEIHLRGDKALSEATGTVQARFEFDETFYDCVSWVRFISCLQKTDGGWKLLTLETIYEFDKITSAVPSNGPVAIIPPKSL